MAPLNSFSPLDNGATQKVLALAEEKKFSPGQTIFNEGDEDTNFYIIKSGSVEVTKKTTEGLSKTIARLKSGDFVGEGVITGKTLKPTSVKAIEDTVLLSLSSDHFHQLMDQDPGTMVAFLLQVLDSTNSRLDNANSKLMALFEINAMINRIHGDLNALSSGLIRRLMAITESKEGALILRNPFSATYRIVFSTRPDWTEKDLEALDLTQMHVLTNDQGHLLVANMNDLGAIVLQRLSKQNEFTEGTLRLVEIVAEQAASSIREASGQAAEKAKKMMERKYYQF